MSELRRDIKSLYVFNEIFSFLHEKQKLDIIIYNKQLQKFYEIDIEKYKKVSGKYRKGEKNGKGSEYTLNTNILIFEGEYMNGKRNGPGIEYHNNGKIKFEGKYLNGKRNGEGKEYYDNGALEFEGEYLNGIRWNGKGYNINGIIDFQIKNGNSKGKEYHDDGKLEFGGEY